MSRERIFREVEESMRNIREVRSELGGDVSLSTLRYILASMVITLGRGAGSTFYRAGYDIGVYKAKSHGLEGVKEAFEYVEKAFEKTGTGIIERWEIEEDDKIEIIMRESATAAGYDIGKKLCYYQAGFIAGILHGATSERWEVHETKCMAEGHDHCEFVAIRRG
ncbi:MULTISPECIES: V4R domain-containing protein [unclassified Methanopyrus]|uniref:V4R domain-containing protein n=1 Tax=Methanopyrus sp. SNP6 TaxID=1937005 RepID=UPI001F41214E|nr:V4R domain-containing protein [Methanopyrus sp. SNP6]